MQGKARAEPPLCATLLLAGQRWPAVQNRVFGGAVAQQ
jgi:hypothetical protein